MKATFVELPAFERRRAEYLDVEQFSALQDMLLEHPEAGDVMTGTGGLRKLRYADRRRGRGRRGGLRVIYFFWPEGSQFWLFTLYDKNEMSDLTFRQRAVLKELVKNELRMRHRT